MSLVPSDPSDPGLELATAVVQLQSAASDGQMLLRLLAEELGTTLGTRMTVERAGGFLRKSNQIKRIAIRLGDDDLEALSDGPSIRCSIGHGSGGIRIRSEQVSMDQWLTRLLTTVQAEAEQSESARQALENIVIGRSTP